MALLKTSSWRARAICIARPCFSQSPVEPSMSVNRKVTVPVGGPGTTVMSSLIPSRGQHYSSEGVPGPLVHHVSGGVSAVFCRTRLSAAYQPVLKGDRRGSNPRPPTFLPYRPTLPIGVSIGVTTSVRHSSARAATSSRQNSGMSGTTRPQTRFPSRNAALSTQIAPAFSRSSLIPSEPVALDPSTMPAEIATSPPWQMMPTVLFLSCTVLTRSVIPGSPLSLSGAQPPGTTPPSNSVASTPSAVVSACASRAFLPLSGSVSGPAETTSAPSSCRRITVTQYSRSSKPSATRTAILFPSNLIESPLVQSSLAPHRP